MQDEEGAIGYIIILQLRNKTGVKVKYIWPRTWVDFAETEEDILYLMSKDIEKKAGS